MTAVSARRQGRIVPGERGASSCCATATWASVSPAQRAATPINRRLNALQHFFAYLATERQTLEINPVKPSHFLRRGRPLPKTLSLDRSVACSPRSSTRSITRCVYSCCA